MHAGAAAATVVFSKWPVNCICYWINEILLWRLWLLVHVICYKDCC